MSAGPAPRIGTAGWSLPLEEQAHFPGDGTHLERYARVFRAAEINSTFHRPHRESTFARWAQSVPEDFRFSVKIPKTITHAARLADSRVLVEEFITQLAPLRPRIGCLLVQLPPKLQFDGVLAEGFLEHLHAVGGLGIAIEPRHPSWFTPEVDGLLERLRVARVAADPPKAPGGLEPGGWHGLAYYRLHGSPRVYYSSYEDEFLDGIAAQIDLLRCAGIPTWCIFDNTTLGAGTGNALGLMGRLDPRHA